jgi:uncharacterized protein YerC
MQVSAQHLDSRLAEQAKAQLIFVLAGLSDEKTAARFFQDFFTDTEQTVLVKRLAIAVMLNQKKSYEEIRTTLKVSSATIAMMNDLIQLPGVKKALTQLIEDQWAETMWQKWFGKKA